MLKIIIDHERYGIRSEFSTLAEAESSLAGMFPGTELSISGDGVYDEDNIRIGDVVSPLLPPPPVPE